MDPGKIFNKWWLLLVHGLLLILLSYFLFSKPGKLLQASVIIAGFIALLTGVVSFVGYFLTGKYEKNKVELYAGIFSSAAGLFFLTGTAAAQQFVVWFFAAFMIFTTVMSVSIGYRLKSQMHWWWLVLVQAGYTLLVLYFLLSGKPFLSISLAVLAAIQFFINGILFIVFAFAMHKLQ